MEVNMHSTLIRCVRTRRYIAVVLMPASEDGPSNYRAIICPQCTKAHFIRQTEIARPAAETEVPAMLAGRARHGRQARKARA
jgi:hypothetical protein